MAAVPLSPLVGRDRELSMLRACLTTARAGNGGLVLIGGEAGIGKTTLAEAVCREATEQGALVLVGRCFDLMEAPPYGAWLDLFGRYQQDDGFPPVPDAFAQRGAVGAVASQAMLFRQVLDFFAALATQRPVVILLDDLHWADPATVDLLRFLARHLAPWAMLIVIAYRSEDVTAEHPFHALIPSLLHEARVERIGVRPLSDSAVRDLIDARYGLGRTDVDRLGPYVQHRAEGNPFFIGELLRTLEEDATLYQGEDRWTLSELRELRVPPLVHQVIGQRVSRLGQEAQRLLAIAAVIGHEVPLAVWQAVGETDGERLLTAIEQAEEAHLIQETPDGTGVRFVHALIREALYERTKPIRRRAVHQRVGDVLAALQHPDADAVAYHFQHAGDDRAAGWFVRAGDRAQRAHAWLIAATRFETALALTAGNTDDLSDRGWLLIRAAWLRRFADPQDGIAPLEEAIDLAEAAHDRVLAAAALVTLGKLRCRVGDYRRGLAELERGVAAIDSFAIADRFRANPPDVPDIAMDEATERGSLALWLAHAGRYAEAEAAAVRAMARDHPHTRDNTHELGVYTEPDYALGYVYAAWGRPEEALAAFARSRASARANHAHVGVGQTAIHALEWVVLPYYSDDIAARHALANEAEEAWTVISGALAIDDPPRFPHLSVYLLEGHWADARELAMAVRAAQGGLARRIVAARVLGEVSRHQGDIGLAWSLVHEWIPVNQVIEPGDVRFLDTVVLRRLAADLALDARDLPAARMWIRSYGDWLDWGGCVLGQSERALLWARSDRLANDMGAAVTHAQQALDLAEAPRQPFALLAAHRFLGELDTERQRFSDAADHLNVALSLADACAAPFERALTLLAIAALRAEIADRQGAAALLDEVRAICIPLGALPALVRCDALATRLAGPDTASIAYPDRLSAREVEVLRLLVQGMSNRAIAARLFVSVRTVERHVRNLYTKIHAHNRVDATAYAFRHNLA